FICEGGVERGVPAFENFVKHLSNRNYKNVQIKTSILENTGHSGTKGEGYARGLQYVFERPSINVAPALLKTYVGKYKLPKGKVAEIKLENKQLFLYYYPNNKYPLQAATETDFYSTAEFLNVRFKQGESKNTIGFQLERYGGAQFASKVNS
ncbi:MAG: DUF3471 domain-containing protein, partial [Flavisolibacter sp.]|nr:DUF3471 domain-containing protein [Flavisolibacter sp.]